MFDESTPVLDPEELLSPTTDPATIGPLGADIVAALKHVYDPEIPVNIYDLGLIYKIVVGEENMVDIYMTLTAPACPAAEALPMEVEGAVRRVPGVEICNVSIVWEPQWTPDRMSESTRLNLGFY